MTTHLVIGIGNRYRRDDGIGPYVADTLAQHGHDGEIIEHCGEGASLMDMWRTYDHVVLIDAAHSGAPTGTIHRFAAHCQRIPSRFFNYSTHAFSVAEAIEMARALDTLPAELYLFGIEGQDFSSGQELTPVVRAAADRVIHVIETTLGAPCKEDMPCTKCH